MMIYNGTKHPINIINFNNVTQDRLYSCKLNSNSTLENSILTTIPQNQVLNIHCSNMTTPINYESNIPFFTPRVSSIITFDIPTNFECYDKIIVSDYFANSVLSRFPNHPILQKLYLVHFKVFDSNNRIIGCLGLSKLAPPMPLSYYIDEINLRGTTDITGALLSLNMAKQYNNSLGYYDIVLTQQIDFIHNFINTQQNSIA